MMSEAVTARQRHPGSAARGHGPYPARVARMTEPRTSMSGSSRASALVGRRGDGPALGRRGASGGVATPGISGAEGFGMYVERSAAYGVAAHTLRSGSDFATVLRNIRAAFACQCNFAVEMRF